MTEFIAKTKQSLFYWWSAWFECVILMAIAGFGCWSSATTNITAKQWVEMPMWDRHKIFVLVAVTMLSNLKSYMSSTLSELKNGKSQPSKPIGTALLFLLMVIALCGCGVLQSPVPANRIRLTTPQGSYDINTPKNVAINNFVATVESNGVLRVSFTNWTSTNDPLVIDKAAAGQVAIINAWNGLVSSAVAAAAAGAVKGP